MKPFVSSILLAATLLLGGVTPSLAVQPDEVLDDPVLEERARDLSQGLRCLVCQNQSIDDSNAELAKDLRVIVRERLVAGDSNEEVLDFVVARYGDYVLLKPPVKPGTYALWFGPGAVVVIGAIGIFFWMKQQSKEAAAESAAPADETGAGLSEAEQARLAALLNEDDADADGGGNRKG